MTRKRSVVSTIEGVTTHVDGRFVVSGPGYQFVADGSLRGGGPGLAPGTADLLLASLVVCALNTLRRPNRPGVPSRRVECFGRIERHSEEHGLGEAILEVFIDGVGEKEAAQLVETYTEGCRVYHALKEALPISFVVHGSDSQFASHIDS